jgi:hypothetical protein
MVMSIVDITEEIASEIDVNAEFNKNGLSISVFVDEAEIHEHVDFVDMAYMMVQDEDKYPPEVLDKIRKGLARMVDILEDVEDD